MRAPTRSSCWSGPVTPVTLTFLLHMPYDDLDDHQILTKMSGQTVDLVIQNPSSTPRSKSHPRLENLKPSACYEYVPTVDGVDTNLLIIFHGLGQ